MTALLSIHSSVTAGFVGNSVAGPVLLSLHVQPLLVDTVLLAAHPGYGRRAGGAVPDDLFGEVLDGIVDLTDCLLYTSPSPRDRTRSRMPSSA